MIKTADVGLIMERQDRPRLLIWRVLNLSAVVRQEIVELLDLDGPEEVLPSFSAMRMTLDGLESCHALEDQEAYRPGLVYVASLYVKFWNCRLGVICSSISSKEEEITRMKKYDCSCEIFFELLKELMEKLQSVPHGIDNED
jgi:hypothetical protein